MASDAVDEKKLSNNENISVGDATDEDRPEYLSMLSKKKFARVVAWIGIAVIFILIVATLITGITGSKYFAGCLFMCIIVPILMYVFLWVGKLFYTK
ncbi:MAG: hypothetical protein K2G45_09715 [Lachnospiraceae bacterium]|nr:hypothetical protein [Lachnospiraceae bacterium]